MYPVSFSTFEWGVDLSLNISSVQQRHWSPGEGYGAWMLDVRDEDAGTDKILELVDGLLITQKKAFVDGSNYLVCVEPIAVFSVNVPWSAIWREQSPALCCLLPPHRSSAPLLLHPVGRGR